MSRILDLYRPRQIDRSKVTLTHATPTGSNSCLHHM